MKNGNLNNELDLDYYKEIQYLGAVAENVFNFIKEYTYQSHHMAETFLEMCLLLGKGCIVNVHAAKGWFENSARANIPPAMVI